MASTPTAFTRRKASPEAPSSNSRTRLLEPQTITSEDESLSGVSSGTQNVIDPIAEKQLVRKIDIRLCTIAGILASLDLLDSNIISSASVTTMFDDLNLNKDNRYSITIFIFTISSILFQLPATILVRHLGPRTFFCLSTTAFGLVTLCTTFVQSWRSMIVLRILLGIAMSGIYPGLSYLISTWYVRKEQQLRFAFLQTGEVFVLATGGVANYGLSHLHGHLGLAGWRWMFLIQGLFTTLIGIATYWWIPALPDSPASHSYHFLTPTEQQLARHRIDLDRSDTIAEPFTLPTLLTHAKDVKLYAFGIMFFLLNLVSTALSYFLPLILQRGLGLSEGQAILLNAPPYYYAILPVLLTSYTSDRYTLRGPIILFNCLCLILGFSMLGFADNPGVRYAGTCLATGAYVSNWAALSAFYSNNIAGQWKRVFTAAVVTAFNGAGGVAGAFLFREVEKPRYASAILMGLGSQVVMVGFVMGFAVWFWWENGRQRKGSVLEGVRGFRYTY